MFGAVTARRQQPTRLCSSKQRLTSNTQGGKHHLSAAGDECRPAVTDDFIHLTAPFAPPFSTCARPAHGSTNSRQPRRLQLSHCGRDGNARLQVKEVARGGVTVTDAGKPCILCSGRIPPPPQPSSQKRQQGALRDGAPPGSRLVLPGLPALSAYICHLSSASLMHGFPPPLSFSDLRIRIFAASLGTAKSRHIQQLVPQDGPHQADGAPAGGKHRVRQL